MPQLGFGIWSQTNRNRLKGTNIVANSAILKVSSITWSAKICTTLEINHLYSYQTDDCNLIIVSRGRGKAIALQH